MSLLKFALARPILARLQGPTNVKENIKLCVFISRYQKDFLSTSVLLSAPTFVPGDGKKSFRMKKNIKDPKELVKSILNPLIKTCDTVEPMMVYRRTYISGTPYWRVSLYIYWPHNIRVSAIHRYLTTAEEETYYKACDVYQKMGLIHQSNGQIRSVNEEQVFDALHKIYSKGTYSESDTSSKHNFRLSTTKSKKDNSLIWKSEIIVPWPFSFSLSSSGCSFASTQYMTCLLAYTRFKLLGLLNERNNLSVHKLPSIRKCRSAVLTTEITPIIQKYEVYVDASKDGLGAYLLTGKKNDTIQWISERWSDHFPSSDLDPSFKLNFDSCFWEYYALVTAVYTWKQKFINKSVLCWSDNTSAVDYTNNGPRPYRKGVPKYGKLHQIMTHTCAKYNIDLSARHVTKIKNQEADLLSKFRISEFKRLVPKAEPLSKKSEKLIVWKPLVGGDPPSE